MTNETVLKARQRQWNPQDIERAIQAVQEGETVSGAAKQFHVPRETLDDRVRGRVRHGTNPGPCTALIVKEESALASYLLYMAERGFLLTTNMARAFAWAVLLRSGTQGHFNEESGPGKHWWQHFRACHPELTLRTADNLECSRANALTRDVVNNYLACLKNISTSSMHPVNFSPVMKPFYLLIFIVQK